MQNEQIVQHPDLERLESIFKTAASGCNDGMQCGSNADVSREAKFTRDGSEALERHLTRICGLVGDSVKRLIPATVLKGVVLGGGYGRGEGGVLRSRSGDKPYNDLEFYVITRALPLFTQEKFQRALSELGHRISPAAEVEVELKLLSLSKLQRAAPSMFYYDLMAGHRWGIGSDVLFAECRHHLNPAAIPLHEATRLLMNRCSGLLFALDRLQRKPFTLDDADFVGRNLAKAQLAIGDVVLTAMGQYHWSCLERNRRLAAARYDVPGLNRRQVESHHVTGTSFKLHPTRSEKSREELAELHAELVGLSGTVLLWIENKRLGTEFKSLLDYSRSSLNKCPETSKWRNLLVNLRTFGLVGAARGNPSRHPRETLLNLLPLMLRHADFSEGSRALAEIQNALRTDEFSFQGLVKEYFKLWNRFN